MSPSHNHSGGHSHAPSNYGRAFAIGVTLNLGFVIAEVIYGRLAHSLALVADAGHNLSDVVAIIVYGTWGLLRDSVNLALDAVPEGIDVDSIKEYLSKLPTCVDVHDLHIWGMSTTEAALTAHLIMAQSTCDDELLSKTAKELHSKFGIEHTSLQVEYGDPTYPCRCHLVSA